VSVPTPSRWADDRLMKAYDLLDEVLLDTPFDHPARALLKKALDLIEDADIAFEEEKA
jgi:hypothetical protein